MAQNRSYTLKILAGTDAMDSADDNVDVEVTLSDKRRFSATFFTRKNIDSLFTKNARTGECASGLYIWAVDMIIVGSLSEKVIRQTIENLIQTGELEDAFGRLDD